MRKIAYIEIDTHAEITQAFMDIMKGSWGFAVDYYLSRRIKDQISYRDEVLFLTNSSIILEQLKGKGYDLVIIGTAHRYFNTFLRIVQKYNTAIITHNLNFTKASKFNLFKSVFRADIIFRMKLWLKEGLIYKTKVYKMSGSLLVLDESLASDRYRFLPLYYTRTYEKIRNDDLLVVIPGGVSQKRRDYRHIISTIWNPDIKKAYHFIFLGKADGHELKQLESMNAKLPKNIKITYFSKRVSTADFEYWMKKADVLWCPIQQDAIFFSMEETYGVTKMTGNIGDAIAYGKPAIFPENYQSNLDFILSEKENVLDQMVEISETSFDFQKNYSREIVLKKLEQFLASLM